jgi:hypothetical protein
MALLAWLFPPAPEPLGGVRRGRLVVARGRVVPRDRIESPLTGERCVYYRYLVEEWRRGSVNVVDTGLWHAVEQDEAIAEFYLDDGTGRALVEPTGAEIDYRAPHGPVPVALPAGRRASELRLEDGDLVEVRGVAEEVADLYDGERGYREPATRLLLRAPDGGRLRIRRVGRVG